MTNARYTRSVTFSVPRTSTSFRVRPQAVAFAGSRNGAVHRDTAAALVEGFHHLGFGFLTGCAHGIDRCFRSAFAAKPAFAERSIVACAFENRARRFAVGEIFASVVVPVGLSPAAALHCRNVWVVRHCSLLVLFPDNPVTGNWGRGSRLAFNTARHHCKPVFLVTEKSPKPSVGETITESNLFGILDGYWVVPAGGSDDEE